MKGLSAFSKTRSFRSSTVLQGTFMVLALLSAPAFAQEPATLEFGKIDRLFSKALNEERRLNVLLPPGYAQSTARYPVIYLLDGSAHEDYFHAASLFDFLATYGVMPPSIVVGISNVDRKRDFTLPSSVAEDRKAAPTSGGALKFIAFLESDLLPYVAARYRTDGSSTIVGQSLGGLVATQVLLQKPQLFNNYVIVSPSLWWDGQALMKTAPAALAQNQAPKRKVYLSVGDEGAAMKAADEQLIALIKKLRPDNETLFDYMPQETHATSLHISLYRAVHFLYKRN